MFFSFPKLELYSGIVGLLVFIALAIRYNTTQKINTQFIFSILGASSGIALSLRFGLSSFSLSECESGAIDPIIVFGSSIVIFIVIIVELKKAILELQKP
jgi:hypothetical protein